MGETIVRPGGHAGGGVALSSNGPSCSKKVMDDADALLDSVAYVACGSLTCCTIHCPVT